MANMLDIRTKVFQASQLEMAAIAGVSQATVSRWDTGNIFPSGKSILAMLAHAEAQGIKLKQSDLMEASLSFNALTYIKKDGASAVSADDRGNNSDAVAA